jgi:hypothetical protein
LTISEGGRERRIVGVEQDEGRMVVAIMIDSSSGVASSYRSELVAGNHYPSPSAGHGPSPMSLPKETGALLPLTQGERASVFAASLAKCQCSAYTQGPRADSSGGNRDEGK